MRRITGIAAITAFLLLCGCQTGPVVWDNSYPAEKLATVKFLGMKIDSYNEINVTKFNWIKIPAGQATFSGEYVAILHSGLTFWAKNVEFTCKFEEGGKYIVQGNSENMQWGISVYKADDYNAAKAGEKLYFTPFKRQPQFQ
jgi:hypothetical protein